MRYQRIRIMIVLGLIAVALPALSPRAAFAAGVVGDGTAASCTEAAFEAALAGGGMVTFDCGPGQHTIALTTTKVISNDTQIVGDLRIFLDMGGNDRHFYVAPPTTLQLDGLFIQGGATAFDGGAIRNDGTVTVNDSVIIGNAATGNGGAIRNDGTLNITDSFLGTNLSDGHGGAIYNAVGGTVTIGGETTVSANLADIPGSGGAIYNDSGTLAIQASVLFENNRGVNGGAILNTAGGSLTVDGATFSGNFAIDNGGAISNVAGAVTISDTSFTLNHANEQGGALHNASGAGSFTVEGSGMTGNDADEGGAIWNADAMEITESNVADNSAAAGPGGGIFNDALGTLTVSRSAIFANEAFTSGGGLYNIGSATFQTSTVSGNETLTDGGGILNAAVMSISDSTIAFNTSGLVGGGIHVTPGGSLGLGNTMFANNPGGDCSIAGAFNSSGFNLDTDGSCPFGMASDVSGGAANLGPLALNDGTTFNHLPGFGSDAIDSGPANCASPDQRGTARPRNGACEIGAIEIVPVPDVCYSVVTSYLQMPAGGACNAPYIKPIVFQEGGPHYLCANPYTGILSYSAGPNCAQTGNPAISMPADGPLAACRNPYTGQLRLPPAVQPVCTGGWVAITLS